MKEEPIDEDALSQMKRRMIGTIIRVMDNPLDMIGSWARFDLAQYTWKTGSSQMLQPKGMRLLKGDHDTMLLKEEYYNPTLSEASADIREIIGEDNALYRRCHQRKRSVPKFFLAHCYLNMFLFTSIKGYDVIGHKPSKSDVNSRICQACKFGYLRSGETVDNSCFKVIEHQHLGYRWHLLRHFLDRVLHFTQYD